MIQNSGNVCRTKPSFPRRWLSIFSRGLSVLWVQLIKADIYDLAFFMIDFYIKNVNLNESDHKMLFYAVKIQAESR